MKHAAILALEIIVLYACGAYIDGRLYIWSRGARPCAPALKKIVYYLILFPGVVLHELSHLLFCLLTGTKITDVSLFFPQRKEDGSLELGHVAHESRWGPVNAVLGLAPLILLPFALLVITHFLTPVSFSDIFNTSAKLWLLEIFSLEFVTQHPLKAAAWFYLALSIALATIPSRADLKSLPLLLLLIIVAVIVMSFLSDGFMQGLASNLISLCRILVPVYLIPSLAALVVGILFTIVR